jgi:hypothetical protein
MLVHANDALLKWASKERLAVSRIREALKEFPTVMLSGPSRGRKDDSPFAIGC